MIGVRRAGATRGAEQAGVTSSSARRASAPGAERATTERGGQCEQAVGGGHTERGRGADAQRRARAQQDEVCADCAHWQRYPVTGEQTPQPDGAGSTAEQHLLHVGGVEVFGNGGDLPVDDMEDDCVVVVVGAAVA